MALELIGKLLQKLPAQSGQSAKGAWSKQDFVLETQESYPRKICASVWGADKLNELASIAEGSLIKMSFNIESRQFNERWYTDIRVWRVERVVSQEVTGSSFSSSPSPSLPEPLPYSDPGYFDSNADIDDLPF